MRMLDRPVWSSLTTAHLQLGEGDALARRYLPDVNLFGAAAEDGAEALARLSGLVAPGQQLFIVEAAAISRPPGLALLKTAPALQMIDTGSYETPPTCPDVDAPDGESIQRLTDDDSAEMLALATLTEPGPFLSRTHVMGDFYGLRRNGKLVAMAGQRMRFPGFREVSGVCTHPEMRGHGLAKRLILHVMASIRARGEQPFLHSWADNATAIRLYENLGFTPRAEMNVAVLARE